MKKIFVLLTLLLLAGAGAEAQPATGLKTLHDFKVETIDGGEMDLSGLRGKKVMIVNTASRCGFTPQYADLEELYTRYREDNFIIIGFPANNFGAQEPGTNREIAEFCQKNYGVTFPMMSKISVKGDDIHPLYSWITSKEQNGAGDFKVDWNFHKFLVDEEGNLVRELEPKMSPLDESVINWISGN